ncbi:MAG TPA: head maturation protease, ClpP-related [Solirubrobacterales bacterium]
MDETRKAWLERMKRPVARLQGNRTDWYRFQNNAGGTPALYIYDEIGYFGHSASDMVNELKGVTATELNVHVNSPGGDIFDGLAIYQALKSHPAKITMHVDGLAASIASVIVMAADRLVMAPKASMMIHDGWTMGMGNAAELRAIADLLDKQSQIIASVYADRAGQTADFWRDRMRDETWYNADEALAAGLVDEIEGQEKKSDAFDLSVFAHAGRESAPAPVLKDSKPTPKVELRGEPGSELVDLEPKKEEPEPFTWDFAAFKDSLKEGIRG